ncbi:hypothetical protein F7725_003334 [Dissostichus mawsoni]|uniref:Uncharacterized protein n=1 Tax=Dissostichus mawsoni TaxID=36200 RepID=A0A7J5Y9W1_DISMA|nr:hypothetical protein F7725_003334 [Dissostichus mawsoni]
MCITSSKQIDKRLDGAADVKESEAHRLHVAAEHIRGVDVFKRKQCYRWQVVKHNDTKDGQHCLEGLLLHGVHLIFPPALLDFFRAQSMLALHKTIQVNAASISPVNTFSKLGRPPTVLAAE